MLVYDGDITSRNPFNNIKEKLLKLYKNNVHILYIYLYV